MTEGWSKDDYLILFEEKASALEEAYSFNDFLPGYRLVGLYGWDNFIVQDGEANLFTVPTVPLSNNYLRPLGLDLKRCELVIDERLKEKIKWYIKPICFGGDPSIGSNIHWVNLDLHTRLVTWWNRTYRELKQS